MEKNYIPQPDDVIENPVTGQSLRFVIPARAMDGMGWVYEWTIQPGGGRLFPGIHYHPIPHEAFEILEGQGKVQIGDEVRAVVVGDVVDMPVGVPHRHPWNDSPVLMRMRHTVKMGAPHPNYHITPAHVMATERLFTETFRLARAGKVDATSTPNPLIFAALAYPMFPLALLPGKPLWLLLPVMRFAAALGRRLYQDF